ncbi:hypothetical protein BH20ACI2_BH20ACI2_17950 [soil metagenome]
MSWLYTVLFAGLVFSLQDASNPEVNVSLQEAPLPIERLQDETEKFEQIYPLNANGRVRISNVNGPIIVEGWDRNEVKLSYTKTADTKERLSGVEIRIDSRGDLFSVESDYGNWKSQNNDQWRNNGRLTVEFRLMVPRGAVLNEVESVNGTVTVSNFTNITRVSVVNGSVNASNIRGTARLSTVNGTVNADFERLDSGSKISLDTINGKVNLRIPSDSNATVKADSLNGNITNEFGLPVRKGKYVGRDLYGKLGSGDVDIRLNSVNGTLLIGRRSDGKSLSPATNLLPNKGAGDDNWDNFDADFSVINSAQINKEVAKAVKESAKTTQKALADAKIQFKKMGPELAKITAESVKLAAEAVRPEMLVQLDALARTGDVSFFPSVPRVEKKSDSIPVKGVPKVTVDAKGCSVSVRGWDKDEVQYRVTQFSSARENKPLDIKESHTDSTVNITVKNNDNGSQGRMFSNQNRVRIEVFVPKKSNLKIEASGEIRIEGVSGDVELAGSNDPINVRDVDGKLRVNSSDGRVRVIGFTGDIDVKSLEGSINLEGDFRTLNARSQDGSVVLTLQDQVSAELDVIGSEVSADGIIVTRISGDQSRAKYRLRDGGRLYKIVTDGPIVVRNANAIMDVY